MSNNYYKVGAHNVYCDKCKQKKKNDQVRKTWDGFMKCVGKCWEPKHPYFKPIPVVIDEYPVANPRPRQIIEAPSVPSGIYTWETANWDDPKWTWEDDITYLNSKFIWLGIPE